MLGKVENKCKLCFDNENEDPHATSKYFKYSTYIWSSSMKVQKMIWEMTIKGIIILKRTIRTKSTCMLRNVDIL